MRSRWSDSEARASIERWAPTWGEDLAVRTYTSRLLGRDPSLVLHGGGNTSVKSTAREITGESTRVLFVKGSGSDLAVIEPSGFPACRLAPLLRCLSLETLTDEDMVKALRSQMLDPASPTPSVEALLHAFIPAPFVDHTHANAVLTVVDQPDGEARARDIWGDALSFVPYVMPGFVLAREIAKLGERIHRGHVLVLGQHGIFTWGDSAQQSYERMIAAVTLAEEHVARVRSVVPAGQSATTLDVDERRRRQRNLFPILRGALLRAPTGGPFIVHVRDEPEILALLERPDAERVTQIGPMTPDHVLRTKPLPVWLGDLSKEPTRARAQIEDALTRYAAWYGGYFDRNASRSSRPLTRLDTLPRVLLAKGLGAFVVGKTLAEANIAGDVYAHTARVIADAADLGTYRPVSHADLFDVEYWSLEQAKLKSAKTNSGSLARRIAVITGAARGIGFATAAHFLEQGAHVVLSDSDETALAGALAELRKAAGDRVVAVPADVTQAAACAELMARTLDAFGGLDVLVSNAGNAPTGLLHTETGDAVLHRSFDLNFWGHQHVARAAVDVLLAQKTGGCLLFNASKSALNPGKDFGPYAVPKAAVIALMKQYAVDLGAHGIRANAVNADRIRTALFDDILETRAKARGISPDDYFRDNLLARETTAADVARAFGFLASAEATTGAVVTVDGGNAAAFVR